MSSIVRDTFVVPLVFTVLALPVSAQDEGASFRGETNVNVIVVQFQVIDKKTGEVVRTLSPAERGESLLAELWLDAPEARAKYRFVAGDVAETVVDDLETIQVKKQDAYFFFVFLFTQEFRIFFDNI